jgi:hypothetical protein
MEENLHNESFDKLLRSKYEHESVQPEGHLWENIQRRLSSATAPVNTWHLNKIALVGGAVLAALGIATILVYQFYLKPNNTTYNQISRKKEVPSITHSKRLKTAKNSTPLIIIGQKANSTANNHIFNKETTTNPQRQIKVYPTATAQQNMAQQVNIINPEPYSGSKQEKGLLTSGFKQKGKNITPLMTAWISAPFKVLYTNKLLSFIKHKKEISTKQKTKKENGKKKRKKSKTYIPHPWSLEVYWRPEYSYRTLASNPSYTQDFYTTSYFDKRDQYKFTYSYGFLFDYRFATKLSIESGLAYYSYELGFSAKGTDLIKKDDHNALIYTSSGSVLLNVENVDSLNAKTILNSSIGIHYLSIPVNLKYYPTKNLFINVGTTIDYNFAQSLNWEEENEKGIFNVESGKISGINRFNISMILGLGYEQQILRNMSFSINPGIRIHLVNLNRFSTVKTFPYHAGFRVSLRYEF